VRKQRLDRFEVRASHREDVSSFINQCCGQGLTSKIAYIYVFHRADFHSVETWGLPPNGVDTGRADPDVLSISDQPTKETFCDGTPTNVACADEEDVFHWSERAASAFSKLEANLFKSIRRVQQRPSHGDLSLLRAVHCGYCDHWFTTFP
jgi:hypothetical protein